MKKYVFAILMTFIMVGIIIIIYIFVINKKEKINILEGIVLSYEGEELTVEDKNKTIYIFKLDKFDASIGDEIILEYIGVLKSKKENQNVKIIKYKLIEKVKEENPIPKEWNDKGIFSSSYINAYEKLKEMTLDEKINQMLIVRYPDNDGINLLKEKSFGGYIFFEKDFNGKTKEEVKSLMENLQSVSKIPILTVVDEEGGTVVRVSSNPNLSDEWFKSPRYLYSSGGFDLIKEDTIKKSKVLNDLGINLNLAPVVDVSINPSDYMYKRSLGQNEKLTSEYAKVVIEASKGSGVSYTLKHFPGYGNNRDTHIGSSIDSRTYEDILKNDLPPFEEGIKVGAEAVLVSHNIVSSIDSSNPASLSSNIHNILRKDLKFTGVIITDDLIMDAVASIPDVSAKAVLAGNDLLITTDYERSIESIKKALEDKFLTEDIINQSVFRILAWKFEKGLL